MRVGIAGASNKYRNRTVRPNAFFHTAPAPAQPPTEWTYTEFLQNADTGLVRSVKTDPGTTHAEVIDIDGRTHSVMLPYEFMLKPLIEKHIEVSILPPESSMQKMTDNFLLAFGFGIQIIVFGALLNAFVSNRMGALGSFGTAGKKDTQKTTFADVAGLQEPKKELAEIVDFLKDTSAFAAFGAELPKGVLLYGDPGTGKTLLAKAVAGEAGVPFFVASGSEFVQVFVGVGSSRIRDLFKRARDAAPCVVFIDEIDAIGRARSQLGTNANSEQEQTMNQLLTEMDGFHTTTGIVVIAATNRKDTLDDALLRSGRFDRHIHIPYPAKSERQAILEVHTRGVPLHPDVCLLQLATATQGLSGADLKTLVNEAKIYAIRRKLSVIPAAAFHECLDKFLLGLENTAITLTPEQTELIAYHEAGHALLGILVGDYDLLTRITIVPRGDAGGLTLFQEKEQDLTLYSQQYLLNRLIVALGGRVAEQCIYGTLNTTTGAASDLESVQSTARHMVTHLGFNETLGQVSWSDNFPISGSTTEAIDAEIKYLVEWAHHEATRLIQENEFYLHRIAEALIKKKTLTYSDILKSIQGLTREIPLSSKEKDKKH